MKKRHIPLLLVLMALTLFITAGAGAIPGLNTEYVSGDTITIMITNSDESVVIATLEANEFDLNKENLNYKRTYAAEANEKDDKITWTLDIDTTGVPLGTYNLVIQGESKILASEKVKIVSKKSEVANQESKTETEQTIGDKNATTVPTEIPASPGFGLFALLGLLIFIRRK